MKLNKLDHKIQEFAKPLLEFGCIVKVPFYPNYCVITELFDCGGNIEKPVHQYVKPRGECVFVRVQYYSGNFSARDITKVIGKPMDWGTICALERDTSNKETFMAHNNLEEIFANMELYDKNLLQRPTTAKRKVLKFLEVWKKNFKKDLQKI